MPEELWTEVCDIVQEAVIKTIPKKKNAKRMSEEALQIAKKREAKGKGEKERCQCRKLHKTNQEFGKDFYTRNIKLK